MSSTFVSVEWTFGDIINYFKFLDLHQNLNMKLNAVGKMYIMCALLINATRRFCGTSTKNYFVL